MRFNYILLALFLNFSLVCIPPVHYDNNCKFNEEYPISSQSYINHPPILITSDSGFSGYSFMGNGSFNNPYLIEGYNITAVGSL
jgi:hypothetical protein